MQSKADLKETLRSDVRVVILVGVDMDAIHAAVELVDDVRRWSFKDFARLRRSQRNWLERAGDGLHPTEHKGLCRKTTERHWLITTHSPIVVGYFESDKRFEEMSNDQLRLIQQDILARIRSEMKKDPS